MFKPPDICSTGLLWA